MCVRLSHCRSSGGVAARRCEISPPPLGQRKPPPHAHDTLRVTHALKQVLESIERGVACDTARALAAKRGWSAHSPRARANLSHPPPPPAPHTTPGHATLTPAWNRLITTTNYVPSLARLPKLRVRQNLQTLSASHNRPPSHPKRTRLKLGSPHLCTAGTHTKQVEGVKKRPNAQRKRAKQKGAPYAA